jgi:hypothetical protein
MWLNEERKERVYANLHFLGYGCTPVTLDKSFRRRCLRSCLYEITLRFSGLRHYKLDGRDNCMDIVLLQGVGYGIDVIVVNVDNWGSARRPVFRSLKTYLCQNRSCNSRF